MKQIKEKVPADFIQLYRHKENTLKTFYTKTNYVVGEPNSSVRTCRIHLHPVHPPSFQIAREVKQRPPTESCRREEVWPNSVMQREQQIHWRILMGPVM